MIEWGRKGFSWSLLFVVLFWSKETLCNVVSCKYVLQQEWETSFQAKITIPIAQQYNYGWLLYITFEKPVRKLDVFETKFVDVHPNNMVYVFSNEDYNYVIYKDKNQNTVKELYLQGHQYPNQDTSVYIAPPTASRVLFIAHINAKETLREALLRAEKGPDSETSPPPTISTTTASTTVTSTILQSTEPTAKPTTLLPWYGWKTDPINILESSTTTATTTTAKTTRRTPPTKKFRHNLREVIKKSLLFFEAQRSGPLPISNRIPWRSDSALRDGSDNGVDLTGGYYTDSGYVKYGFPTASAITILSWGAIEFKRGYVAAKELGNLIAAIKWGTDYLLKCFTDSHTFYGQVSDSDTDNVVWNRPEDMRGVRPSYKLTRNRPGSDLAAEAAAAFAAASIVMNNTNPEYSQKLRNYSISLFRFADRYRGKYDVAIPEANSKYGSSGYFDELAWAAAWLYGITEDVDYLDIAKRRLSQIKDESPIKKLDWDDKRIAVVTLLAQMTNRTEYRIKLLDFCDSMVPGFRSNYTHKGLLFLSKDDTTALASSAGFICLFATDLGLKPTLYRPLAQTQLNYILGDAGQSFVVGYGKNSPQKPYHKSSSCPKPPLRCSWLERDTEATNPHELTGALVNGPDIWDNYKDDRNSPSNTVSIYNNAVFQTLAAGILKLQVASETFSDPEPGELLPSILLKFDKYQDYSQVLRYSDMFYEAQRSGKLPTSSRIQWRKSACVDDKSQDGNDLSGGFFDGGDYIKFNFPMAYTTTVLAWSLLMFPQSYDSAGETAQLRSILRWSTDYFIKCHTEKYELYGQVGSSALEHSHWLRPEDIKYIRPAFKITMKRPGSDLAAETAAAMAATASAFFSTDPKYATTLIKHAKELYQFAVNYRGVYHRSIADAAQFYPSFNGYNDEIVWASIWLYLATNETAYLKEAKSKYKQFRLNRFVAEDFYWDDKTAGVNVLLARITKSTLYLTETEKFCDSMMHDGKYTPKGLLYRRPWGPLQYSSGAALICMLAAELGIKPQENREFSKKQIHYILGDSGMGSYVVGYGPSPPKQPHHRASSCPLAPTPCNYTALYSKENNPHTLYGAVVGGPDQRDQYVDDRANVRSNKVTLAYNAAFQAAVAGLKYLQMFPPPTEVPKTTTTKPKRSGRKRVKIKLPTKPTTTAAPVTASVLTNVTVSDPAQNSTLASNTTNITGIPPHENATAAPPFGEMNVTSSSPSATNSTNGTFASYNVTLTAEVIASSTINRNATVGTNQSRVDVTSSIPLNNLVSTPMPNSTRDEYQNTTMNGGKRTCGRLRALQLFDQCVIPTNQYQKHPDSKIFRCRYHAFKACVGVQTDNCVDSVWEYWPYWNDKSDDNLFFGEDDRACKDQNTVDIEKCELRGFSIIFDRCYDGLENWNSRNKSNDECRWVVFGTCVTKHLSHCKRTWDIWKIWNLGLPVEQQFTDYEMECNSAKNNIETLRWIIMQLTISIYIYIVHTFMNAL